MTAVELPVINLRTQYSAGVMDWTAQGILHYNEKIQYVLEITGVNLTGSAASVSCSVFQTSSTIVTVSDLVIDPGNGNVGTITFVVDSNTTGFYNNVQKGSRRQLWLKCSITWAAKPLQTGYIEGIIKVAPAVGVPDGGGTTTPDGTDLNLLTTAGTYLVKDPLHAPDGTGPTYVGDGRYMCLVFTTPGRILQMVQKDLSCDPLWWRQLSSGVWGLWAMFSPSESDTALPVNRGGTGQSEFPDDGPLRVTDGTFSSGPLYGDDFDDQQPLLVLATPSYGMGKPLFRALVADDLPSIPAVMIDVSDVQYAEAGIYGDILTWVDGSPLLLAHDEFLLAVGDFTGATLGDKGLSGLVPAPMSTDLGKFLSADGTWRVVDTSSLTAGLDEVYLRLDNAGAIGGWAPILNTGRIDPQYLPDSIAAQVQTFVVETENALTGLTDAIPGARAWLSDFSASYTLMSTTGYSGDPTDPTSWLKDGSPAGLSSVGLAVPDIFTIDGPLTSDGELTLELAEQAAGTVFAAPSDVAGLPVFRKLGLSELEMPEGFTAGPWVSLEGGELTGPLSLAVATVDGAGLSWGVSTAIPSTPVDGQMWFTGSGLQVVVGGEIKTLAFEAGGATPEYPLALDLGGTAADAYEGSGMLKLDALAGKFVVATAGEDFQAPLQVPDAEGIIPLLQDTTLLGLSAGTGISLTLGAGPAIAIAISSGV